MTWHYALEAPRSPYGSLCRCAIGGNHVEGDDLALAEALYAQPALSAR